MIWLIFRRGSIILFWFGFHFYRREREREGEGGKEGGREEDNPSELLQGYYFQAR